MSRDSVTPEERYKFGKSCCEKLHRVDQAQWKRRVGLDVIDLRVESGRICFA